MTTPFKIDVFTNQEGFFALKTRRYRVHPGALLAFVQEACTAAAVELPTEESLAYTRGSRNHIWKLTTDQANAVLTYSQSIEDIPLKLQKLREAFPKTVVLFSAADDEDDEDEDEDEDEDDEDEGDDDK